MKRFLIMLAFTGATAAAQDVALLDRAYVKPMMITNEIGLEVMSKSVFPLYMADAKQLIKAADSLVKAIDKRSRNYIVNGTVNIGHSKILMLAGNNRHILLYNIVLVTEMEGMSTSVRLAHEDRGKIAIQKLVALTNYLRNNLAIAEVHASPGK